MRRSYPRTSLRIGALARTMARQWHAGSASEHRIRTRPTTVHCGSASSEAGGIVAQSQPSRKSTITRAEHRRFIRVCAIALPPRLSTSRGSLQARASPKTLSDCLASLAPWRLAASPTQRLEEQRLGKQASSDRYPTCRARLAVQQANRS